MIGATDADSEQAHTDWSRVQIPSHRAAYALSHLPRTRECRRPAKSCIVRCDPQLFVVNSETNNQVSGCGANNQVSEKLGWESGES